MALILTDENFEKEIKNQTKPVLVDFFATWCEPCTVLGPILEKVAKQFEDKIVLAKVDIGTAPAVAQKFEVEKIPTVVLLKDGKAVGGFVGLISEKAIKDWLENTWKN